VTDTRSYLRARADTVEQDWPALAAYLAARGMRISLDPPPRQFSGGLANLNYLIVVDGREYVLRRPPMGTLPPGAYEMGREFHILSGLSRGFQLAPSTLHFCEDPAVIGAPFQIIEYRQGISVPDALPESLTNSPAVCRRLSDVLGDVLVQLHALDPASVGLAALGRPDGFLRRTVEGWAKRALLATEGSAMPPLIPELIAWLRRHLVPDGRACLIHNDLKLDNILLNETSLSPMAVLDWDQCTRGDPLFDLATTLSYLTEDGDPPAMQRLRQMPTALPGFLTRQAFAERYARAAGVDLSDFRFVRVLAIFKLAVIFHQLHLRYRTGATADPRYAEFGALADGILEFGHTVAAGHIF
jgi:aminoglycoside phosphotransferase (APT) family kinase protein